MRSVSLRRGAAVLAVIALIAAAPASFADEGVPSDPQARIGPPGGVTSPSEAPTSLLDLLLQWLAARIGPPGG